MKKFYAYTRVSTLKQGEKGVSLQEQRAAIERYAERQDLQIIQWFEERLTAAKGGRPIFATMLKGLRNGKAGGVIIHKIDRGARNLRDWADLGDLIDAGVVVCFANESLDLQSRSGRLSADIQAVVAADYVRNLREETRKGLYGRLKQGVYPFQAPIGYLNTGSGRVKEVDPVRAPVVRQAFEKYATGRYTLDTLLVELHQQGLRNRNARLLSRNSLSVILNNPFYAGLIRIKRTSETYAGGHTPLISMTLFKQVGTRLTQRVRTRKWIHEFAFRGLFRCSLCGHLLVGELQKGHKYYRCQTRRCPTKTFREETLDAAMMKAWAPIARSPEWRRRLLTHIESVQHDAFESEAVRRARLSAQMGALKQRLGRLVDALVDGALDKTSFEERKRSLLEDQQSLEQSLETGEPNVQEIKSTIADVLELAASAQLSYRLGSDASRRELAIRLCSNRTVAGKDVSIEPSFPMTTVAKRDLVLQGGHHRDATRTLEDAAKKLWEWGKAEVIRQSAEAAGEEDPALTPAELRRLRRLRASRKAA